MNFDKLMMAWVMLDETNFVEISTCIEHTSIVAWHQYERFFAAQGRNPDKVFEEAAATFERALKASAG